MQFRRVRGWVVVLGFVSACGASDGGAALLVDIHGSGSVTSMPAGLACDGDACTLTGAPGTAVTLTATGDASTFAGWTGACTGSAATCTVELTSSTTEAAATFVSLSTSLAVMFAGGGSGSVTSTPEGIDCTDGAASGCTAAVPPGTVALTATPAASSVFVAWSGGCTGSAATCTTTIGPHLDTVTARFEPASDDLTVEVDGQGTVTATPGDIDCADDAGACAASLPYGTTVTLTATPSAGWRLAHWNAACGSAETCQVTLDGPVTVSATFTQITDTLSVVLDGTGSGEVVATSSACSGGVCFDCPDTGCSATLGDGATVTLTASAGSDSELVGWSAPCSGTDTCTVTIDDATIVHATFGLQPEALTVELTGAGVGNVSATGLIDCGNGGSECSATVSADTPITLRATPSATSRFVGWSGPCTGTSATCVVELHDATTVTAAFGILEHTLWVELPTIYVLHGDTLAAEPSEGTVVGTVDGSTVLDCTSGTSGTCSVSLPVGSQITLTGTPSAGTSLAWETNGGPCSGSAPCTITLSADTVVDAVFAPVPVGELNIDISEPGSGDGVAVYSGDTVIGTCPFGGGCTYYIETGALLDLEADASTSSDDFFKQWNGPCYSTIPDCPFTLSGNTNAIAEFESFDGP